MLMFAAGICTFLDNRIALILHYDFQTFLPSLRVRLYPNINDNVPRTPSLQQTYGTNCGRLFYLDLLFERLSRCLRPGTPLRTLLHSFQRWLQLIHMPL